MFTIIFLVLLSLVIYNHLIYPLLLTMLSSSKIKKSLKISKTNSNKVAVVVTAYNEDKFIEQKINNFKLLNYLNKSLFIYNDGSSDKTLRILNKYINDKNITIINKTENKGKIDSINSYIRKFSSNYDYTIFTDASASLEDDFIERILGFFTNNKISVVSSSYYPHKSSSDGKYWKYQRALKEKEEMMGNVLGVHGSGYMIKNEHLEIIPINSINDDFILPSLTIKNGCNVVYSDVPSYEMENDKEQGLNYTRRLRIGAGNLQQIFICSNLFNIFKNPLTTINFFSIKVLRTFMPFIMLTMLFLVPFIENLLLSQVSSVIFGLITLYVVLLMTIRSLQSVFLLKTPFYILKSYYYSGVGSCYFIMAKKITGWYNPLYSKRVAFNKRVFDITTAIILFTLSIPVLLLGIIAIKIENFNAPIFFVQKRVGMIKDGKENLFNIIKLRTMIVDAEKETGAVFAQKNDARITRVGKFLRKTRIDEIPQFLNVLNGDMSLVGPRPERPEMMEQIKKELPDFYKRTEHVKPGITGLAQVKIGYNFSLNGTEEKYKMDQEYKYKSNQSLFGSVYHDLSIMIYTVGIVVTMKGV